MAFYQRRNVPPTPVNVPSKILNRNWSTRNNSANISAVMKPEFDMFPRCEIKPAFEPPPKPPENPPAKPPEYCSCANTYASMNSEIRPVFVEQPQYCSCPSYNCQNVSRRCYGLQPLIKPRKINLVHPNNNEEEVFLYGKLVMKRCCGCGAQNLGNKMSLEHIQNLLKVKRKKKKKKKKNKKARAESNENATEEQTNKKEEQKDEEGVDGGDVKNNTAEEEETTERTEENCDTTEEIRVNDEICNLLNSSSDSSARKVSFDEVAEDIPCCSSYCDAHPGFISLDVKPNKPKKHRKKHEKERYPPCFIQFKQDKEKPPPCCTEYDKPKPKNKCFFYDSLDGKECPCCKNTNSWQDKPKKGRLSFINERSTRINEFNKYPGMNRIDPALEQILGYTSKLSARTFVIAN